MKLIKIGGAAITEKQKYQTINEESIDWFCSVIEKIHKEQRIIIVHGAGSFGHFEAKKYKLNEKIVGNSFQIGISLTRKSVKTLNSMVVKKLIEKNINAVGISCITNFKSKNGEIEMNSNFPEILNDLLTIGLIPVIHGDVVFDSVQKCSILSGDIIMMKLSEYFKPEKVYFISNVHGIYSSPPKNEELELNNLIKKISVKEMKNLEYKFEISQVDVTNGILGKFENAINIAKLGIEVFISKTQNSTTEKLILNEELDENDYFTKIEQ
eukprot:gene5764-9585_t